MIDALLELHDHGCGRVALHGQDEREAEPLRILAIERSYSRKLLGRAARKARALLLPRRFRGELTARGGAAGELRMRPDQRELFGNARAFHCRAQGFMQMQPRAKRALRRHALGDPWRVLEDARQRRNEFGSRLRIESG